MSLVGSAETGSDDSSTLKELSRLLQVYAATLELQESVESACMQKTNRQDASIMIRESRTRVASVLLEDGLSRATRERFSMIDGCLSRGGTTETDLLIAKVAVARELEVQERSIIQIVQEDTKLSITENQSTLEVLAGAHDHIIDRRDTTKRAENESTAEASVPDSMREELKSLGPEARKADDPMFENDSVLQKAMLAFRRAKFSKIDVAKTSLDDLGVLHHEVQTTKLRVNYAYLMRLAKISGDLNKAKRALLMELAILKVDQALGAGAAGEEGGA